MCLCDSVIISTCTEQSWLIFGKCVTTATVKHLSQEEQQEYHKKHAHIAPEIVSGASKPSAASDVYNPGFNKFIEE